MSRSYLPESEFLNCILHDEIPLNDSAFGRENLRKLLSMVDDPDRGNRDWATFLIAGLPFDAPEIRQALARAADDDDYDTRDEAIVGLARRDRLVAIERLQPLLTEEIGVVLLEAATILGMKPWFRHLRKLRVGTVAPKLSSNNWDWQSPPAKQELGRTPRETNWWHFIDYLGPEVYKQLSPQVCFSRNSSQSRQSETHDLSDNQTGGRGP